MGFFNDTVPEFLVRTASERYTIPGLIFSPTTGSESGNGSWHRVKSYCDTCNAGGACTKKDQHPGWDKVTYDWSGVANPYPRGLLKYFINGHNASNASVRKLQAMVQVLGLQGSGGLPDWSSQYLGGKVFTSSTQPLKILEIGDHVIKCEFSAANAPNNFSVVGGSLTGTLLTIGELLLNDSTSRQRGIIFYALDILEPPTPQETGSVWFHTWSPVGTRIMNKSGEADVSVTPCFWDGDGIEPLPRIRDIFHMWGARVVWTNGATPAAERITILDSGRACPDTAYIRVEVKTGDTWAANDSLRGLVKTVSKHPEAGYRVVIDLDGLDTSSWQDLKVSYWREERDNPTALNVCQGLCANDTPDYTGSVGEICHNIAGYPGGYPGDGIKFYCDRRRELSTLENQQYLDAYTAGQCMNQDCPYFAIDHPTNGLDELHGLVTTTPIVRKHELPFANSETDSTGANGWRMYRHGLHGLYSLCNAGAFDTAVSPVGHFEEHDWSLMTGGWGQVMTIDGLAASIGGYEVLERNQTGIESLYANEADFGPGGNLRQPALTDLATTATGDNDKSRLERGGPTRGHFGAGRYDRQAIGKFGACSRYRRTTLLFPNIDATQASITFNDGTLYFGNWDTGFQSQEEYDSETTAYRAKLVLNKRGIRSYKTTAGANPAVVDDCRFQAARDNYDGTFTFWLYHGTSVLGRATSEPGELNTTYPANLPGAKVELPINVRYRNWACPQSTTGSGGGIRPGQGVVVGDFMLPIVAAVAADPDSPEWAPNWPEDPASFFADTPGLPGGFLGWGHRMDSITVRDENGVLAALVADSEHFYDSRNIVDRVIALPGEAIKVTSPDPVDDVSLTATAFPGTGTYFLSHDFTSKLVEGKNDCLVMEVDLIDLNHDPSATHDLNTVIKSLVNIVEGARKY